MARGINKVILVGTLGKDPEVRYSQSGGAITSVSLATNEKWKDKNGEMQERTEWHRVKFFGRLAEIAGEYLKKGRQVYIEGEIRYDKFTGQDGVEKYFTDIVANEMQMLGGGGEGSGGGGGPRPERAARPTGGPRGGDTGRGGGDSYGGGRSGGSAPPSRVDDPFPDDDIPF